MTIGFRILQRQRKAGQPWIARFLALPVANVSDNMWRMTAGGPRLRPMHGSTRMAGPALTVRTAPGDNLMIHKAIDISEPGDVIVVDGGGDLTNALIGELMLSQAIKRGVAGIVINGAVRDADAFPERGLPVFAAGVTHRGPYKNGPGEINTAIALDGMVIEPGDMMLGDSDGLLCVPYDQMEAVCVASESKLAAEEKQMADIEAGTLDRSWVDESLKKLGCEM